MRQTFFLFSLLFLIIFPDQLLGFEFEFEDWSKIEKGGGNDTASTIFANLALLCFIIANVYTPAKFLIRKKSAGRDVKDSLANLLKIHVVFNAFMFVFTILHSHYADATSVFLILSLIAMICLVIGGSFLRFSTNLDMNQRQNLLSIQQILFGACVFLLVLGHVLLID